MKKKETHKPSGKDSKRPGQTGQSPSETAPAPGNNGMIKTRWWFYLIAFLIPVMLIVMLEAGLRVFNYGRPYVQWVKLDETSYILNPDIAFRYFYSTRNVPYSNQSLFDIVKAPNAFRVFILGESSAAGFPYLPNGSFAKYLKQRLTLLYPGKKIEIVNIAMTAINTYSIRDMMPEVIEQKPDLILIYTGHNEYYGALGAGSMESLGTSRTAVNFMLWLNRFKTVELFRNVIKSLFSEIADAAPKKSNAADNKTLMSRMAKDQLITLNSNTYRKGLEQFEGNMRDILEMAKDANVPVILSTLASNLKDQSPFISTSENNQIPADKIYKKAQEEYKKGNYPYALKLFRQAKDLDALRFRAPEAINRLLKKLAREYSYPIVDNDSVFNSMSPHGITGNNLMTDHLHPTIEGYQIIGRVFFNSMLKNNLLPGKPGIQMSDEEQDKWVKAHFNFSVLDSVIGSYRIQTLKNDWPYIKSASDKKPIVPHTFIDSLAYGVVAHDASWEEVHRKAANYYINHDMYDMFEKEINILIDQFPFIDGYISSAANFLLNEKQYDRSLKYFYMLDAKKADAATAKWIGIINLSHGQNDIALRYLEKSLSMDPSDSQVLYNIAGVYLNKKDYRKALDVLNKCLSISPNYPAALSLRTHLSAMQRGR